jgi:RNA polymerase sigma factor (sigma-70 family)
VSPTQDDRQPYPSSLARTVLLSMHAVRAADRTGVCTRVLEIMAVLSSAGVRRELLYAAGQAGVLASGRHRVAAGPVDRVLKWLGDRSLLTFSLDGQTVILHHLVARVIRDELDRRQMMTAVCEAAAFVLDVYSRALVGSQDRRAVRGIPQQVTALLDSLAGPETEVDEELAFLLLRLRFAAFYHLLELGDSTPQAIAAGEPLTQDLERLLGPDHPDTLNSRNSLAAAYLAAARVAEAIPLFEQTLAVRQRMLGRDDPETLTSQNNLASAYQDAGRIADAIRLYELNLEARDRLLDPDDPSTLNSRGNLAAAYLAAGRAADAIPLLERTLADRERVLGPDHPDAQTSLKNLAKAYQDAGRATEAIPLLERASAGRKQVLRPAHSIPSVGQTPAARKSRPRDRAARQMLRVSFRRPPADQAMRVLPAGLRRPPVDSARQPLPDSVARLPARLTEHSSSRTHDTAEDVQYDRELIAAITAEDPAGTAMMYEKYAASLYGYCHWMLHDSAEAAGAVTNTFLIAAATLGDLSEPSKLRPRLFELARNEGRRRVRPTSAARDEETDVLGQPSDGNAETSDAASEASDATVSFRAASEAPDATVSFRAVGLPSGAASEAPDATVSFQAVGLPSGAASEAPDATVSFGAVDLPSDAADEASDATVAFAVISLPSDPTMVFRVVSQPTPHLAYVNGDRGEAELRTLIYSILAGLKPREREVIELSFRHDLNDDDLAIALGVSSSRAHALASRARSRLEEALSALHIALTRRETCPALKELLANWDGQLTEDTRDLVIWHIGECQTCTHHGWGALRAATFSRLLPLAPLPPELREQVLSCCTSTAEDAVAYRQRVARHADSIWFTKFSPAVRHMSWAGIRAHPGAAIAAAAVVVWVVAAVSITLLTFAGSHAAYAQVTGGSSTRAYPPQTTARTSPGSPAAAPATVTTPRPTAARPSPTFTQPSADVSSRVQPAPSPEASKSPSSSAKPSRSPSPKPPTSSSPKPSKSPSPKPSTSPSPSPSSSPSPTP